MHRFTLVYISIQCSPCGSRGVRALRVLRRPALKNTQNLEKTRENSIRALLKNTQNLEKTRSEHCSRTRNTSRKLDQSTAQEHVEPRENSIRAAQALYLQCERWTHGAQTQATIPLLARVVSTGAFQGETFTCIIRWCAHVFGLGVSKWVWHPCGPGARWGCPHVCSAWSNSVTAHAVSAILKTCTHMQLHMASASQFLLTHHVVIVCVLWLSHVYMVPAGQ